MEWNKALHGVGILSLHIDGWIQGGPGTLGQASNKQVRICIHPGDTQN